MSDYRLIISPVALNDLKGIYQFSLSNWGASQSLRYLENLKERLWALTEHPLIGTERMDKIHRAKSYILGGCANAYPPYSSWWNPCGAPATAARMMALPGSFIFRLPKSFHW